MCEAENVAGSVESEGTLSIQGIKAFGQSDSLLSV